MNENKIFLMLLKNSIFSHTVKMTDDDFDCQKIYKLAQIHHVLPMIHEQINYYKDHLKIPDQTIDHWRMPVINTVMIQENATSIFLDLYQKMINAGIFVLVVKGIVLRQLYPHPNYRMSSDEDIWIQKQQVQICEDFLIEQGYKKESYSSDDTLSFTHQKTGFHLEVHVTPFSMQSAYKPMNEMFTHCYEHYKKIKIDHVDMYTLTDTDHYLYLIAHAYQHFMSCGVGIRQLIDITLYKKTFEKTIYETYIYKQLKKYHLETFYDVIEQLSKKYILGDINESLHSDDNMYDLLQDILNGGVYGKSEISRISGSQVIHAQLNGANSSLQKWKKMLFPSSQQLISQYIWLNKYPYLLPVAWMMRYYRFLKRHQFKLNILHDSLKTGEMRLLLAKKYDIL